MSPDPSSQQANSNNHNKKEEEQFPIKLHRILEEAEANGFSDCISWMPDGTSFKIFDKTRLENEVMPQYFESCQFKSFQRSLNMWGFVADNKKSDTTTGGGRRHHPLFVKGRPELCCAMRRVRVKKPGARGKKAVDANNLSTPPDSPTRAARHEEATTVASGFLAPCLLGDRFDQSTMIGNIAATTDHCSDLVQQLVCQSQSNALLHALLASKLQPGRLDQEERSIMHCSQAPSHAAETPTDFANRSILASTLAKMLTSTTTTSTSRTPSLQHLLPSIMGAPLTPAVQHRGYYYDNADDDAALRQTAIALATAGWLSPSRNTKNPEYLPDTQPCETLFAMNLLLQQQPSSTHSYNQVITDAITRTQNLVRGAECNTSHNSCDGGGSSTSTTGTASSPRQNNMDGAGLEHHHTSPPSSSLQNPTMNTLDLASSLLLQHYSVTLPSSRTGPS